MAGGGSGDDGEVLTAPRVTMAQKLCRRILTTVQSVDADASISSVSKWDNDDSTLVRVRTSGLATASTSLIVGALRAAWPLASVSIVENVVDGTSEAQVLVPSLDDQRSIAQQHALDTPLARALRKIALLGAVVWAMCFAMLVLRGVAL